MKEAGNGEKWKEPFQKLPDNLPPGGEKGAHEFSFEGNFPRLVNVSIGIGVTVAMIVWVCTLQRTWESFLGPRGRLLPFYSAWFKTGIT